MTAPPDEAGAGIVLPAEMDAARGAMAMAMWAVPRVDPWLNLLCESLAADHPEELANLAEYLRSPWWILPPWIGISSTTARRAFAAVVALRDSRLPGARAAPAAPVAAATDLVNQVAADVNEAASGADLSHVYEWTQQTIKVLRGEARLIRAIGSGNPVGKAIQLVLLRPDPSIFRKWKDDLPSLPPRLVVCSGAMWTLHGYRRLPTSFRGDAAEQRSFFAIHALRALGALPENWAALV